MATKQASKQAASRELTKTQWKLKEIRQNWVAYLMVAPYMILFTLFTVVPVGIWKGWPRRWSVTTTSMFSSYSVK